MHMDTVFSAAAACVGAVSGWHFCRVNLATSATDIHAEAWPQWEHDDGARAPTLIDQAANTFAGGVLLVIAFALQIVQLAVPRDVDVHDLLGAGLIAAALLAAWVAGERTARARKRKLCTAVQAIRQQKEKRP